MIFNYNTVITEKLRLFEGKTSNTLVKLGLNQPASRFFENTAGKLGVWLFSTYAYDLYPNSTNPTQNLIDRINQEETWIQEFRNNIIHEFNTVRDYINAMDTLGNPVNIKDYVSLEEIYDIATRWHDSLTANPNFLSENMDDMGEDDEGVTLISYPEKNNKLFYWQDLETNNSESESKRMGHCGHSPKSTTLYSLRSHTWLSGIGIMENSHITVGVNTRTGVTYQIKGKKNSLPSPKYHPYIVDLLIKMEDITSFGTEYDPANDFKIPHLKLTELKRLKDGRPDLVSDSLTFLLSLFDKNLSDNIKNNWIDIKKKVEDSGFALLKDTQTLKVIYDQLSKERSYEADRLIDLLDSVFHLTFPFPQVSRDIFEYDITAYSDNDEDLYDYGDYEREALDSYDLDNIEEEFIDKESIRIKYANQLHDDNLISETHQNLIYDFLHLLRTKYSWALIDLYEIDPDDFPELEEYDYDDIADHSIKFKDFFETISDFVEDLSNDYIIRRVHSMGDKYITNYISEVLHNRGYVKKNYIDVDIRAMLQGDFEDFFIKNYGDNARTKLNIDTLEHAIVSYLVYSHVDYRELVRDYIEDVIDSFSNAKHLDITNFIKKEISKRISEVKNIQYKNQPLLPGIRNYNPR
jgi:hypothetical protein